MYDRLIREIAALPSGTLRRGLFASLFMVVLFFLNVVQIFQIVPVREISIMQDFWAFHAAAEGTARGGGALLYDVEYFQALFPMETGLLWLYPPTMLMFLAPFGFMSYGIAKIIFIVMNVVAIAYAAHSCGKHSIILTSLVLISPAFYVVLYVGQLSVLFATLLVVGLLNARSRPILAGICLGLLTMKPQLGLLVPFFLVFIGAWRTFSIAAIVALLLVIGSVGIFGVEVWAAFLESLTSTHISFSQSAGMNGRVAFLDVLRGIGLTPSVSLFFGVAAFILSVYVIFCAKRNGASERSLVALTVMLVVVSAPYLWIYEWVLAPLAILIFLSEQPFRLPKFSHITLLSVWYAPLLPYLGGGVNYAPLIWGLAAITAVLMYLDIRRKSLPSLDEHVRIKIPQGSHQVQA